jgi:hypothetical protein
MPQQRLKSQWRLVFKTKTTREIGDAQGGDISRESKQKDKVKC